MSTKKILPFEIDDKSKTFRFNTKNYQELFKENSEVNAAFRAAIALGCYDGYTPVLVKRVENPDRNTATQNFTEKGVEKWLQEISEEYFEKFDPDDKEGKFAIVYEFKRRRAFTRVLTDLIHQIEADLPAADWVGRLSVEDQREGVPA